MPREPDFQHHFEGPDVLDELLAVTGSALSTMDVRALMQAARAQGQSASEVIPTLFEGEPHFPSPLVARHLYQNLLGLWDDVATGRPAPTPRRERPRKPPPPQRPAPWGEAGPSPEWVAHAAAFLQGSPRERERLLHSFENRQDALLTHLDEQALSDGAYGCLREVLAALHGMLELGRGESPGSVDPIQLRRASQPVAELEPLMVYADEALSRAAQHQDAPLSPEEARALRDMARGALSALWLGRGKGS
jgi:hypothetical protein